MRDYSDARFDAYVASGDPMDKAGAYGIQHAGFHPVQEMRGCFASVMGLPLCHLLRLLMRIQAASQPDLPGRCQTHLNYACPVSDRHPARRAGRIAKETNETTALDPSRRHAVLLAACSSSSTAEASSFPSSGPRPRCRRPTSPSSPAPDAHAAMTQFLEALKNNDFTAMYAMLSSDTQAAVAQDVFLTEVQRCAQHHGRGDAGLPGDEPAAQPHGRAGRLQDHRTTPRWSAIWNATWWPT